MKIVAMVVFILLSGLPVFAVDGVPVFTDKDLEKYKPKPITSSSAYEKIPQQIESSTSSHKPDISKKTDTSNIAPALKSKWNSHIDFLKKGQTAKALELICTAKRQDYAEMFKAIGANIGKIVSTQTGFELLHIDENLAKFNLTTNEAGTKYSYEVSFVKDFSGNWCILQY